MTETHQEVAETSQSHWDHSLHWDSWLQQEPVPFLEQAGNSVLSGMLPAKPGLVLGAWICNHSGKTTYFSCYS